MAGAVALTVCWGVPTTTCWHQLQHTSAHALVNAHPALPPTATSSPPPTHLCQQELWVSGPAVQAGQQVGQPNGAQLQHTAQKLSNLRTNKGIRLITSCLAGNGQHQHAVWEVLL